MIVPKYDLTGEKYGMLTVIRQAEDIVYNGTHYTSWECLCDCGNQTIARGKDLRSGYKQSCGCLPRIRLKKYCSYDLTGEYGIGKTIAGEEFWFDLDDYELIRPYCWFKDQYGYFLARSENGKHVRLHRLIMGVTGDDYNEYYIDHIGGANTKHDNRKKNLRIVTPSQSVMNRSKFSNNTSGITGIYDYRGRWMAMIVKDGNRMFLGYYDNFEDAVKARKAAEEKYFGEYSYDNSQQRGDFSADN